MTRLTVRQLEVLRAVRDGRCWRSNALSRGEVRRQQRSYVGGEARAVTAVTRRLQLRGLIVAGEPEEGRGAMAYWQLTDAGRAHLSTAEAS